MLTIERLREVLNYDPETGKFIWLKTLARRAPAGSEAGTNAGNKRRPYVRITIAGEHFHAGPLAWFYAPGVWPKGLVDHRDGDPLNNRLANLREASDSQNQANRRSIKTAPPGSKASISTNQAADEAAEIMKDRRKLWLGCHDTPADAHAAYCEAARNIHGEFAKLR